MGYKCLRHLDGLDVELEHVSWTLRLPMGLLKKEGGIIKMKKEDKIKFDEYNHWLNCIANGCEHMKEPPYIGIPSPLPSCALTKNACRIDTCPKAKGR